MTYRGNFSKHPITPETGSPAYTRTRLVQSSDLELKPTQATLLGCLSWDALCVPQAVGSKRGHPSTSYIWLLSLTVSPVTNFCTTNLVLGSVKLIRYIFQIWNPKDPLLCFFLGTRLFAVKLTFGEVYVIATEQNIFLQNSWLLLFSAFSAFDLYRFQLSLVPSTTQNILRLYFGIA